MNKEQFFQNLKYVFLTFATVVVLYGLGSQLGLSVQAAQLPANPGSQLPSNPGSQLPSNPAPAAPAPQAPAPQAPAPAAPAPVVTPASNLNGSCPDGSRAFFTWSPASKTGVNVTNYTLRLNKEPFGDWMGPGDHAFQVGNTNSYNDALPAGRYGFSIQAGFSDGSTSQQVNGPEFNCAAPAAAPAAPTPTPPLRLGCNDACTSNSQCNNDDANRACIGGFCRLSTNPSSVTCSPPAQVVVVPQPPVVAQAVVPTATPVPPTPTPVPGAPTPTPTPTPAPAGATAFACPSTGGTFMINGSIVNCNAQSQQQTQNNTQIVTVGSPAPVAAAPAPVKVAGVANVKELPKTGLPLAAWAISGLLPLGVGLKRLAGSEGEESEKTASYLWEKRQYLQG